MVKTTILIYYLACRRKKMNLRKSIYFKPLCLLVVALFTGQCISIEKKLVSTEEKVIENGSQAYVYELEKVKTPSTEDPTVEYKIVKFPANRIESISTYKLRKIDRSSAIVTGVLAGALAGWTLTLNSSDDSFLKSRGLESTYIIALIGGLIGGSIKAGKKSDIKGEIKEPTESYLKKKSDSTPIPVLNLPLEFSWWSGKSNTFKTQTDEQGLVRINLVDDLKMTKVPPDRSLILYIHYFNPVSQLKEILRDSLGPEK